MQVGTRKLKGFYHTLYSIVLLTLVCLFAGGVELSGDNFSNIIIAIAALASCFFGANFGEHYSKSRSLTNGNENTEKS